MASLLMAMLAHQHIEKRILRIRNAAMVFALVVMLYTTGFGLLFVNSLVATNHMDLVNYANITVHF